MSEGVSEQSGVGVLVHVLPESGSVWHCYWILEYGLSGVWWEEEGERIIG